MHLLVGHTLYLTFRGLLGLKSSYRSGTKERQVLRRISIVLHGRFLRRDSFLRQCRVNLLRQVRKAIQLGLGPLLLGVGRDILPGVENPLSCCPHHSS